MMVSDQFVLKRRRWAGSMLLSAALVMNLAACGGGSTLPSNASALDKEQYLTSHVDEILFRGQSETAAGLSIIVVKDGKQIYNRSKGLARLEGKVELSDQTVFELASVSKPITAIAIMQLREQGMLALDDSLLKWLPELPVSWRGVTVHHLLSQQSGIPDYMTGIPSSMAATLDGFDIASLFRMFTSNGRLTFLPGTNAQYTNSNYVLLAEIVARASGVEYGSYLQAHVFKPAGMRSSFVFDTAVRPTASVAFNFATSTKTFGFTLATHGPTGIFSSTADMRLMVDALLASKLVTQESLALMTRPQSAYRVVDSAYGYGFFVLPGSQSLSMFAHAGSLDGYRNVLRINKERGVYYVILSNGGDATEKITDDILGILQWLYET